MKEVAKRASSGWQLCWLAILCLADALSLCVAAAMSLLHTEAANESTRRSH